MDTPEEFLLQEKVITPETIELAKTKLTIVYDDLVNILKDYIETTEENYKFIALWIVGTYFHESFYTYPYLFFNAMRGSGKTRVLKLISHLSSKGNGSIQNNLTEAVLFRIPRGTTTCIDEIEQIGSKEKQTLRELLNSAYKQGMEVKRMRKESTKEGERQVTETFRPYFPIAMANINGMDEVTADRAITIILEKSNHPLITRKIEDFDINPKIKDIKRTLEVVSAVCAVSDAKKTYIEEWNRFIIERYGTNNTTTLTTQTSLTTPQIKDKIEREEFFTKVDDLGISGRNFELLFPILIVSKYISSEVFVEACNIGAKLVDAKKEEEKDNIDVSLYEFVSSQKHRGLDYIPVKDLVHLFRTYIDESFDWLNERWLGRALKRLNLVLDKRKMASGRQVILNYNKASEKLSIFKKEKQ